MLKVDHVIGARAYKMLVFKINIEKAKASKDKNCDRLNLLTFTVWKKKTTTAKPYIFVPVSLTLLPPCLSECQAFQRLVRSSPTQSITFYLLNWFGLRFLCVCVFRALSALCVCLHYKHPRLITQFCQKATLAVCLAVAYWRLWQWKG
jgi:hypothetical protein